ncbi:MAG: hypothetical protein Fur0022_09300 [Anaerolineales bacterium]
MDSKKTYGYTLSMSIRLSRREFLKLSALSGAIVPWSAMGFPVGEVFARPLPPEDQIELVPLKIVRVAIQRDEVRAAPSLDARIMTLRKRDELVKVFDEFIADGPPHNPRWYRVIGGFMHTAHLAPVDTILNPVINDIRPEGQVFRVTVPYTQSWYFNKLEGWIPMYRLYYNSNHWVIRLDEGPTGQPMYVIEDDLLHVEYFVEPTHLQLIPDEEFAPISPDVQDKYIEVSLAKQTVTCFENGVEVFHTKVSTGIPGLVTPHNGIPTETPRGEFNISIKTPVRHMGDGQLTSDIAAYELPGVPWTTFFTDTGVAFHGTYWHDNYGGRMSHGCVNMRTEEAQWLYRWTTPVFPVEPGKWHVTGFGTRIKVI